MKITKLLTGITLFVSFMLSSCEDKEEPLGTVPPGNHQEEGAVTPVGTPSANAITGSIGPSGGEISDSSGRITVTIPPGALARQTEISIQPITNFSAGKRGDGFRLLPHGQRFEKPVKVTFQYDEPDTEGTLEEALGICYQNDQKIWMSVGSVQRDTIANHVSVQTTHFSDWALFAAIDLTPQVEGISPGGQVPLLVHYNFKPKDSDDLLAPLVQDVEAALQNAQALLDPKYIVSWEKQGEGSLQASANKGKYSAPAKTPARNPVEIVVKVRQGKSLGLLISKIYVAPEGISVSVNNGEWHRIAAGGYNRYAGTNLIAAEESGHSVKIVYPGKMFGQYAWTLQTVGCTYTINAKQVYYHIYGGRPDVSKGYLNVTHVKNEQGAIRDLVLGTFDIPTSGYLDTRTPVPNYSTQKVRGVFRVPRVD